MRKLEYVDFYTRHIWVFHRDAHPFWNPRTAGKVYTEIVPDASKKPLQAAIRCQVAPYLDSIIHSDGWRGYYNGLVDMGYQKHLRVHP